MVPLGAVLRDIFYEILSYYEYNFGRMPRFDYASVRPDHIIDPLYGDVELPKSVCYLLSFPIVDRLRDTKQLGLTDLVYTGATHTRLEHSLGVSYLLCTLPQDVNEQEKAILSVIGLLHDIGHSGWGHALDGITSRVVSEISEVGIRETFPLFSPKKLDMVVTSYLLYQNDQVIKALGEIARALSDWPKIALTTYPERLRDFIAWVVAEEKSGNLHYCRDWLSEARKLEDLAHYFQNLLGFKVNADRLDWIERDAHHAFCSVDFGHAKKVKTLSLARKKLRVRRSKDDVKVADLSAWKDLDKSQHEVRELLYATVYEGVKRSFIDSLLTRLVYCSILSLSTTGNQIASPSAKARVIMGYIFSPDSQLRYYTEKILRAMYYSAPILPHLSDQFVRNSYRLWTSMFENLRMVLSLLGDDIQPQDAVTSVRVAGEVIVNRNRYTVMYLDGIWLSTVTSSIGTFFKSARGEESLKIVWHSLNEFLTNLRTDTITVFATEKIENRIAESEGIRGKVQVYILPNYYFLRRIVDGMPKFVEESYDGKTSIITQFIKHLEKKYRKVPLVFMVIEGELEEKEKAAIIKQMEDMLSTHLANLLGDKLTTSLSIGAG
jgi:hypothetical protein